jgi:hypothetical protein
MSISRMKKEFSWGQGSQDQGACIGVSALPLTCCMVLDKAFPSLSLCYKVECSTLQGPSSDALSFRVTPPSFYPIYGS